MLGELRTKGARSVLLVPAVFCASPEEMQALEGSLGDAARARDDLDLAWLPGLGAELCCAPASD